MPEAGSRLERIKTVKTFDNVFEKDDLSAFSVDGVNIKTFVRDMMLEKNVATPTEDDIAYYCKAFIIYSMTEKEPVVTVERNGEKEAVYDLPGLDHSKDEANLDNIIPGSRKSEISSSAGIKYRYFTEPLNVQKALAAVGVNPDDSDVVNALFISWLIGEKGYSFDTINKIDTLNSVQINKLTSDFFEDLMNHPVVGPESDKEKIEENLKWLAGMTQSFMNKYEVRFKLPSEKQFDQREFKNSGFGDSFEFLANQGAGLNKFLNGLFEKGGKTGPDNPYGVDYRSAFCNGYSNIDEYLRHRSEMQYGEAMARLAGMNP